jgi:hypothetical protein
LPVILVQKFGPKWTFIKNDTWSFSSLSDSVGVPESDLWRDLDRLDNFRLRLLLRE